MAKDGKWIQKATASIKKRGTKGKCTPISKPGCTGKAKALAKTFKKMAKNRKSAALGDMVATDFIGNQDVDMNAPIQQFDENGNPISRRSTQAINRQGNPVGTNFSQPLFNAESGQFNNTSQSKKQGYGNPYGLPYHFGMAVNWGNEKIDDQAALTQAKQSGNRDDIKTYRTQLAGDNMSITGHSIKGLTNDIQFGVGLTSKLIKDQRVAMEEQSMFNLNNRERAEIKPFRGDSELGGGTLAAYSKYGSKLPMYEHGGANVIYERGETVSRPSGEVEHINYGDKHSDPSGGIPALEEPGTVIHPEAIGTTVGDFLQYAQQFPNSEFISNTVMNKYKKPDKEVSYSDIAKLFKTKDLEKDVLKIGKKLTDATENISNPNNTTVTSTTAKLNSKTLSLKKREIEAEIDASVQATGSEGPVFNMAKDLKESGAYGKRIQNEANKAKFGRLVKNKVAYNKQAPGIPVMKDGDVVSDAYNKYIQKGDKWFYYNDNKLGTEVPKDARILLGNNTSNRELEERGADALNKVLKENLQWGNNPAVQTPTSQAQMLSPTTVTQSPQNIQVSGPQGSGNYSTADKSTHFAPEAVTNFKNLMWMGDKNDPRAEQVAAGLPKGFNKSPFAGNAYAGIKGLFDLGFDPSKYGKDWNTFGADDTQDFLYNADKNQGFKNLKLIFNHYKDTNQGELKGLKGKQWEELNDSEVKDFFNDNKYGVRTYLAQALTSPPATVAEGQPEDVVKKDGTVDTFRANLPKGTARSKRIYQEGLHPAQIAAPILDLLTSKQAVPYIEDQGAKDSLAMNTKQRYTDIQPQLNRITRDKLAGTKGRNPAVAAQLASNAYEASNQVYGQKYNADAQIEQNYNNQQIQLRTQAGANKAKALDTLAQRTATRDWKDTAMFRNAVGEIGNKEVQNLAENRAAALYQDMFKNYGLNPNFTTGFVGGNQLAVNPLFGTPPVSTRETEKEKAKAYYKALYGDDPVTGKYGTKVKLARKKTKKS